MTILILVGVIVAALALAMFWLDRKMISRDIGCANDAPGRAKAICQALSKSMEWT